MIDCKGIAANKKAKMKNLVEGNPFLQKRTLYIIQVGNNPASSRYVKYKQKDCEEVGIRSVKMHYEDAEHFTNSDLLDAISLACAGEGCCGVIIQLPLPKQIDLETVLKLRKEELLPFDVDGFIEGSGYEACTPKGVLSVLDSLTQEQNYFHDKEVVVIGQSNLVGKPLVKMLLNRHCTVVSCNSRTKDLKEKLRHADVVVSAAGVRDLVRAEDLKDDAWVIDVGINIDENGVQHGDCADDVYEKITNVTPPIGGMGVMTRVSLLENCIYDE